MGDGVGIKKVNIASMEMHHYFVFLCFFMMDVNFLYI